MSDPSVVSAQDSTLRNSPMTNAVEDESTVLIATASRVCYWNSVRYEEGAAVSEDGKVFECSLGHWVPMEGTD